MKKIYLEASNSDRYALVDDKDYTQISKYKWYLRQGYAVTLEYVLGSGRKHQKTRCTAMHRMVLGAVKGQIVDHKNRMRLDNQRCNLRFVTTRENAWNKTNETSCVGVTKDKRSGSYTARLGNLLIGTYVTQREAIVARDKKCLDTRGEFAVLNLEKDEIIKSSVPKPLKLKGATRPSKGGVGLAKNRRAKNKWRCYYKKKHIGWYETEEKAKWELKRYINENS